MRRLTQAEYNNTIFDLLGDDTQPANDFVPDGKVGVFANNAYSPMTTILATQYGEAAEAIATRAVTNIDRILPCTPATDEEGCAQEFITTFGKRAYRRPLSTQESERFHTLYLDLRNTRAYTFADAIRVLLQAMLESPSFLYHVERGEPAVAAEERVLLSGHEVASRLSYFLWGTMPDDALFAAADSGQLRDEQGILTQYDRMISDPRTKRGVLSFYRQWLELPKVEQLMKSDALFPTWRDGIRTSAMAETERLIDHVVWEGDGRLRTLLTAPFSFIDAPLAELYGVPGVTSTALQRVDLDPTQRAGILSHASILAGNAHSEQTSPVHRGKFVRERLLCQDLPSPPPTVDVTPPAADPTLTTRQRYAQHSEDEYCAGCHRLMDPIGLGFEKYDAIGRYRTTENGLTIDDTGEIVDSRDSDGAFRGAIELANRLADSEEVMDCVAEQWFGYAVGRGTGFPEDACSIVAIGQEFKAGGGDLRQILRAVVRSDGFRYRQSIVEETCQ